MKMAIIDGKKIAHQIQAEIAEEVKRLETKKPTLAVVLVGDHPASHIYVSRKTKACRKTIVERGVKYYKNN